MQHKDWVTTQPRGGNKPYRFAPKWNAGTIQWIIKQVNEMTDFIDIQTELVKKYDISWRSAEGWIEIARRVMVDMKNGLSLDDALERDRERRNQMRRKKK